jgi:Icc-related predicted phosphoesterase
VTRSVGARVACVGDVHMGPDSAGIFAPLFKEANQAADVLLFAGDLTRVGSRREAEALAAELDPVEIPMVGVLGNHDYHSGSPDEVTAVLARAGMRILEGESLVVQAGSVRVGVAGTKGFGGGFLGASGSDFGEPEMKAFIEHTRRLSCSLETALGSLAGCCDVKVALLHYSPVRDTLEGERTEIYPFLGSYLLGEAIDAAGADLVVHGHAHGGTETGFTPAGIPVRNVALPLIRDPYRVFVVGDAPGGA